MKDATSIVFDLKNLFTLGNSVSWEKWQSIVTAKLMKMK